MEKTKENALMSCSTLDELLNVEFGAVGTPVRDEFDKETEAFCLAQTLREERIRAGLTQEQLAEKIGMLNKSCAGICLFTKCLQLKNPCR